MGTRKIELSDDVFEAAQRTAAMDNIDVNTFLEGLVRRHAEYVATLEGVAILTRTMKIISVACSYSGRPWKFRCVPATSSGRGFLMKMIPTIPVPYATQLA
jgi:hypothetical protein